MGTKDLEAVENAGPPDREVVHAAASAPVLPIGGRQSQVLRQYSAHKSWFALPCASARKRHACWQQAQRTGARAHWAAAHLMKVGSIVIFSSISSKCAGGLVEDQKRSHSSPVEVEGREGLLRNLALSTGTWREI